MKEAGREGKRREKREEAREGKREGGREREERDKGRKQVKEEERVRVGAREVGRGTVSKNNTFVVNVTSVLVFGLTSKRGLNNKTLLSHTRKRKRKLKYDLITTSVSIR